MPKNIICPMCGANLEHYTIAGGFDTQRVVAISAYGLDDCTCGANYHLQLTIWREHKPNTSPLC
jgi:hypothetical protein